MKPVRTSRDKQQERDKQPVPWTQWIACFCLSHLYIGDKDRQAVPLHHPQSTNYGQAQRTSTSGSTTTNAAHRPPADHRLRAQRNRLSHPPASSRSAQLRVTKSADQEGDPLSRMATSVVANTHKRPPPGGSTPTRQFAQPARESVAAPMRAASVIRNGFCCSKEKK